VQGWEERPRLHVEGALGDLVDPGGNSEAVKRLGGKGLEDQQVQGSLEEIGGEFVFGIAHIDDL
jgi:hypothetical protein